GDELVLPVSADLFPNMAGRQITSVYTRFELTAPGAVTMTLNGQPDWTLEDGKVLSVNRLAVGGSWRLACQGDRSVLTNVNLALGYKATVECLPRKRPPRSGD